MSRVEPESWDYGRGTLPCQSSRGRLLESVDKESGTQLRLEPGALWRHDLAGVGDVHELLDGGGEHGEGDGGFAGIHELDEFARAADAADEVNALAGARVVNAEDGCEESLLETFDIEA